MDEEFWSDTPEAEEYRRRLKEAAERVEKKFRARARADAQGIMRTSPEALTNADVDEFWQWWGGLPRATDLHWTEISGIGGGVAKGKGGRSRRGKDKKGNKVITNVWEGI